jgi:lactoylglutathione lyase
MSQSPAGLFRGLFETHLHVADLEKAMAFYGEVLGLELGLHQKERRAAFYWIGRDRSAMLGLWEKPPWFVPMDGPSDVSGNGLPAQRTKTARDGDPAGKNKVLPQHLAFAVELEDLTSAIDRLKQRGVELRDFFDRVTDEPSVFGWIPAASIYFNDVDGHLLEFIARLKGEPAPEVEVVSLTEWAQLKRSV